MASGASSNWAMARSATGQLTPIRASSSLRHLEPRVHPARVMASLERRQGPVMNAFDDPDHGSQKALVTGATSGLGRAIAMALARDGFEVIVHGRDARRGAQAVDSIERAGGAARFAAADLSEPADIERLATDPGEVDLLVNNAGCSC